MATHEGSLEITTDIDSPSAGETTSLTESKESTDGVRKRTSSKAAKTEEDEPKKKNKPWDNRWVQQRIPACRPIWHPLHVFVLFLVTGLIFVILGGVFLGVAISTREVEVEYTSSKCIAQDNMNCEDFLVMHNVSERRENQSLLCHCKVTFRVDEELRSPVHVYYGLNNFYQNHRRYVSSWSQDQLRGENLEDTNDCDPASTKKADGRPILPCGLRMNSYFTDVLTLENFLIDQSNIAWPTDRAVRFGTNNITEEIAKNETSPPPFWTRDLSEIENGLQNESLIVWFRASAFPWFRKLYGRIHKNIPPGNHTLQVVYNYPVKPFSGTKMFVLSEVSWLGGKNLFLGLAYIVTGSLSVFGAVLIIAIHFTISKWKTSHQQFKELTNDH